MKVTEKQLRRLNRMSLLEIIVEQKKQIEDLESRLAAAEERLAAKHVSIDLQNAGSWDAAVRFLTQACNDNEPKQAGNQEMPDKEAETNWLEQVTDTEDDKP
jgi:hypothetical protein